MNLKFRGFAVPSCSLDRVGAGEVKIHGFRGMVRSHHSYSAPYSDPCFHWTLIPCLCAASRLSGTNSGGGRTIAGITSGERYKELSYIRYGR